MNEELEKLLAAEVDKHVDAVAMPDDLVRTAREYGETRDLLDRVSKYKDDLKEKCENFMRVLVPAMESAGIKSINIEGLGRVGTASDNTPKVVDDDLLHEWLYQQGEEGLIKRSVNYMTLKGFLNRRQDEGLPMPPADVCEVTRGRTLRFTRLKK